MQVCYPIQFILLYVTLSDLSEDQLYLSNVFNMNFYYFIYLFWFFSWWSQEIKYVWSYIYLPWHIFETPIAIKSGNNCICKTHVTTCIIQDYLKLVIREKLCSNPIFYLWSDYRQSKPQYISNKQITDNVKSLLCSSIGPPTDVKTKYRLINVIKLYLLIIIMHFY